jgi:hypothetical protein
MCHMRASSILGGEENPDRFFDAEHVQYVHASNLFSTTLTAEGGGLLPHMA